MSGGLMSGGRMSGGRMSGGRMSGGLMSAHLQKQMYIISLVVPSGYDQRCHLGQRTAEVAQGRDVLCGD